MDSDLFFRVTSLIFSLILQSNPSLHKKSVLGDALIYKTKNPHTLDGMFKKWGNLRKSYQKYENRGFPGGAVVKNPPANAGDVGSSPGPGRSHMLQNN